MSLDGAGRSAVLQQTRSVINIYIQNVSKACAFGFSVRQPPDLEEEVWGRGANRRTCGLTGAATGSGAAGVGAAPCCACLVVEFFDVVTVSGAGLFSAVERARSANSLVACGSGACVGRLGVVLAMCGVPGWMGQL